MSNIRPTHHDPRRFTRDRDGCTRMRQRLTPAEAAQIEAAAMARETPLPVFIKRTLMQGVHDDLRRHHLDPEAVLRQRHNHGRRGEAAQGTRTAHQRTKTPCRRRDQQRFTRETDGYARMRHRLTPSEATLIEAAALMRGETPLPEYIKRTIMRAVRAELTRRFISPEKIADSARMHARSLADDRLASRKLSAQARVPTDCCPVQASAFRPRA